MYWNKTGTGRYLWWRQANLYVDAALAKVFEIGFQIFLFSLMINTGILSLGVEENMYNTPLILGCGTQPLEFREKIEPVSWKDSGSS